MFVRVYFDDANSTTFEIPYERKKISSSVIRWQNEQLREDLRDIQRQSDAQRESLLNKMDSDQQMSEKMKNKNIMLNNTLDENRVRRSFFREQKLTKFSSIFVWVARAPVAYQQLLPSAGMVSLHTFNLPELE